jgi:hypothetical protein
MEIVVLVYWESPSGPKRVRLESARLVSTEGLE